MFAEIYIGRHWLYPTATKLERLALLERVLGPFPVELATRANAITSGIFQLNKPPRVIYPPPTGSTAHRHWQLSVRRIMNMDPLPVRIVKGHNRAAC